MKKFATLALVVLMLVASVFVMSACQDPQTQTDAGKISVEETGMPQLLYVQGQDLDMSNGMLTIEKDGQKQEIPLNSEGITVTGYDKNTLGNQTITIAYGGQTTQITVTVVARMQAVEFTVDYLVGDAFDFGMGRLKITRDDGSNHTVLLNGNGVTINGFDGTKAGKQTLTATYANNGETYECKFEVTVHAVDNVTFTAPKKVNYNSHEAGIDLTDGYFTITGNNGALVRTVAIDEDMVEGFDLTAVNEENTPFTQSLKVTYGGKEYSYDIKLTYTAISRFKKDAVAFAELDWNGAEVPTVSTELGELALELMEAYLDLSPAEKNYITKEESLSVARAALMYGVEMLDDDLVALAPAFVIAGGELEFTCESYEGVEAAVEILDNDEGDLYRISPILVAMVEEFANEQVMEGLKFGQFGMLPNEIYEELLEVFEHMLDAYDVMMEIGEDWQTVGVEAYADQIVAFYNVMAGNDYVASGMGYIYSFVSGWRTNADAFDALYTYYYGNEDVEALSFLAGVELPTSLSLIAYHASEMMAQVDDIGNYAQVDTTLLMYHYYAAVQQVEALKNGDDEMAKNLYNILPINALFGFPSTDPISFDALIEYLRVMQSGYYQFSGGLLGVEAYHNFMDNYMAIITNMMDDETYEGSEQYGMDLVTLFNQFVDLKPTEQYYLLTTLNAYYAMSVPPLAFDDSGDYADLMCFFVTLVNEYYRAQMGDNAQVYNDLVLAMEIYAQRVSYPNWLVDFNAKMDSVDAAYAAMSDDEKAVFDQFLGNIYTKYDYLRDNYAGKDTVSDLGEWADEFAALNEAILQIEIAGAYIQQEGLPIYSVFLGAYERAMTLANYILENAPEEILEIYYYEDRNGRDENGNLIEGNVATSFEYAMTTYRTLYVNYLLTAMGGSIYDAYIVSGLPAYLESCHNLYWAFITPDTCEYDQEQVMAAINGFRNLTLEEQVAFIQMEGEVSVYYTSLDQYLAETMTETGFSMAAGLMNVEQYYVICRYMPDPAYVAELNALLDELVRTYESASDEDKASFAPFLDMYNYYIEKVAELSETPEVPEAA